MGVPTPRTAVGQGRAFEERLAIVEARVGQGLPGRLLDYGRGPTSERDILFGIPSTLEQRVELANRRIVWFNTDRGWWESYYAVSGSAGLTTRGLMTGGPPAAWYPIGDGPLIHLQGSPSGQLHNNGQEFTAWQGYPPANVQEGTAGANFTWNTGGSEWWDWVSGRSYIEMKVWGFYDILSNMTFPGGGGIGIFAQQVYRPSNATNPWQLHKPIQLISGYGQQIEFNARNVALRAGDRPHLRTIAGNWTVGGDQTFLEVRYRGPLLAP